MRVSVEVISIFVAVLHFNFVSTAFNGVYVWFLFFFSFIQLYVNLPPPGLVSPVLLLWLSHGFMALVCDLSSVVLKCSCFC